VAPAVPVAPVAPMIMNPRIRVKTPDPTRAILRAPAAAVVGRGLRKRIKTFDPDWVQGQLHPLAAEIVTQG
jgi:hypothetical protein